MWGNQLKKLGITHFRKEIKLIKMGNDNKCRKS